MSGLRPDLIEYVNLLSAAQIIYLRLKESPRMPTGRWNQHGVILSAIESNRRCFLLEFEGLTSDSRDECFTMIDDQACLVLFEKIENLSDLELIC